MKRESGVEANVGVLGGNLSRNDPARRVVDVEGKFVRQSGGKVMVTGVHGRAQMRRGKPEFVDAIKGGVVPREFIPAVEKGDRSHQLRVCSRATRWWT